MFYTTFFCTSCTKNCTQHIVTYIRFDFVFFVLVITLMVGFTVTKPSFDFILIVYV